MMPVNRMVDETAVTATGLDPESAWWLRVLAETGPRREAALARLHELLVRVARAEVARRGPRLRIAGPELDDLACQAAADALMAVTRKLGQFRGESRFTTWACKFVIFEVSGKIGRHFWRNPAVPLDAENWDRLPARFVHPGRGWGNSLFLRPYRCPCPHGAGRYSDWRRRHPFEGAANVVCQRRTAMLERLDAVARGD